ncbi:DNA-directed RNA polymerase subunit epsilon [Fundicoccus sp. Sow4_D5]|uniref:DNA-directed RNA polymerase subunit epsilon n=1 Tax=unclassified Fundicoccus TaxID=2761543 RepID=UPI003F919EAD
MIFKVIYQESKLQIPNREKTKSMFLEADSLIEAREKLANNTPYNIELVQEVSGAHLEYERENNPDFNVVEY